MSRKLTWSLFWPRAVSKINRITLLHLKNSPRLTTYAKFWTISGNDCIDDMNKKNITYTSDREGNHANGATGGIGFSWRYAQIAYPEVWSKLSLPSEFEFRPIIGHPNVMVVDENAFRILTEDKWKEQ